MNKSYKGRRTENLARLDTELRGYAKQIGHHGVRNFIESIRQRCHCQITEDYARELLGFAGYTNPKP
jgi:hypothetical protein